MQESPLPFACAVVEVFAMKDILYAAGSCADLNGDKMNKFYKYDPSKNHWETLAPLLTESATTLIGIRTKDNAKISN